MHSKVYRLLQLSNTFSYDFKPDVGFIYFKISIHKAIKLMWPSATIKGCRYHLEQSLWPKVQYL